MLYSRSPNIGTLPHFLTDFFCFFSLDLYSDFALYPGVVSAVLTAEQRVIVLIFTVLMLSPIK